MIYVFVGLEIDVFLLNKHCFLIQKMELCYLYILLKVNSDISHVLRNKESF